MQNKLHANIFFIVMLKKSTYQYIFKKWIVLLCKCSKRPLTCTLKEKITFVM